MDNKEIRFIDPHYNTLFMLPDGGNIVITCDDGEWRVAQCKYIDPTHLAVDGECYHICQLAEIMQRVGSTIAPETAPVFTGDYHVMKSRTECGKMLCMGCNPGAERPWATWQSGWNRPAEMLEKHDYSKRCDANRDYDIQIWAIREGKPRAAYVPESQRKGHKDMGVPE